MIGLGTLRAIGIGLMFAGVTTITGSVLYYFKGKTAGRAEVQRVLDQAVADHNAAAMSASEAYRRLEHENAVKLKGAQDALDKERAASSRIAADLRRTRTERDGLRDQISAYAAGGGDASADSVAACRGRTAALGNLLDEALRASEESAADGERCEAGARALLEAWPGR